LQAKYGFIKKPKHVAKMLFSLYFNYILYNKGCVRIKSYIHFISSSELLLRLSSRLQHYISLFKRTWFQTRRPAVPIDIFPGVPQSLRQISKYFFEYGHGNYI